MSTTTAARNMFDHHATVSAVTADWLGRRARLDKWADRAERGRIAAQHADRCAAIRAGR